MSVTFGGDKAEPEKRPMGESIWRGARGKCPACGQGSLFRAYLKVADSCDHCGEDLHHHRADDAPPYITIVIVGHLLIGLMLHLEMNWHIHPGVYLSVMVPLAIVMPLMMLPWVKGAVVGLQWANRMHGFGTTVDPETGI